MKILSQLPKGRADVIVTDGIAGLLPDVFLWVKIGASQMS
jgi:hypothetical protein